MRNLNVQKFVEDIYIYAKYAKIYKIYYDNKMK